VQHVVNSSVVEGHVPGPSVAPRGFSAPEGRSKCLDSAV
jgi:hypothetical protein